MISKNEDSPDVFALCQEVLSKKREFIEKTSTEPEALYLGRMDWKRFLSMVRKRLRDNGPSDAVALAYTGENNFLGMQVIQVSRVFHIGVGLFDEGLGEQDGDNKKKSLGIPRG